MIKMIISIERIAFLLFIFFGNNLGISNWRLSCPKLFEHTFKGYVPRGNLSSGTFTSIEGVTDLKPCVLKCCEDYKCNVAFMNHKICYHIACISNDLCIPMLHPDPEVEKNVYMILVKPVDDDESWEEILTAQDPQEEKNGGFLKSIDRKKLQEAYKDFMVEEYSNPYECEVGDESCLENEICVPTKKRSPIGTCECKPNYERLSQGTCVPSSSLGFKENTISDMLTERILQVTTNRTVPVTRKQLSITADSKQVKLPENEVSLEAKVSPEESDEKYQFEWTSLHQPEGSTAVKHQNGGKLQLSKLSEGLYMFKVSASTTTSFGETFVNVTVLPPSRINKPPEVVITPANQTIKQPNAAAVLDASSSKDDDGIVSWHWELQQGPLGYQPQLSDNPTLQLNDLTKPGNYTFKLTVTDTDKATSSSLANITVLKSNDYPPEANAGEDKIIYLPHNAITLNGNLSTDDHNITTWEWIKSPDDAQKAVDMQDTRTPYLQLSNLEEGMYTFTLKVTDSAGQSSTAQVHVFVKPPTNKPPTAEAGSNITMSLPQTWAVVDGRNSSDDNKIVAFKWEQIEGPSKVEFHPENASVSNVTGLTKGTYTIKLSVTDDNNNVASDTVYIIVNQNKNQKPTANAGPDLDVELPRNVIYVNGSASKDDWAIVKWKWVRDEKSLALGNIAEESDESPILIISDLAVGKYIFNLTVYDEQGLSDTDQVTINVKHDPKLFYLIESTIDVYANYLTEAQYGILKSKLALLVSNENKMIFRNVQTERGEGKAKITFYVEDKTGKTVPANEVVGRLRRKLKLDSSLLGFTVAKLQTSVCQNNCSGHGVCIETTRMCKCEAFWMQNMFKVYFNPGEDSDCSWSILYVVLAVLSTIILLTGMLWGTVLLCCNLCKRRKDANKPTNYKLIENSDDIPPFARKAALSDSDTDSDVVFESRVKPGKFGQSRNGHKHTRNGFTRLDRRIKI
ncbi:dyslexia-associated protein KIAA0319 homolog [Harmonia axyridis]|uniref:dyslexia-associated protein KIAA0319 homolog n=1 Tax=Harmonia axyridis TaxID=115357 RepID=UPI001E27599D|nr:dyslexia-associated protein KIAA0319 homolog [Harmonia axyridis]